MSRTNESSHLTGGGALKYLPIFALGLTLMAANLPAQEETSPTLQAIAPAAASPAEQAMAILSDESIPIEERRTGILRIVNQHPDVAEAWASYGEALEKMGDREKALLAFTKATQLNPSLYSPWYWIGIIQKRGAPTPDYPKAELAFRRALTEGAPKPQALNELGVSLALQGKMKEAVDCWKEAVTQDPQWGALYNNIMKGAARLNDEELGWKYLDAAIAAERFEESAVMQFGEYLSARGKSSRAVEVYTKAVAAHPDNARIRYYHGVALGESGKKDEAIAQLREATRIAAASTDVSDISQAAEWAIFRIENPKAEKQFQEARKLVFQPEADWSKISGDLEKAVKMLEPLVAKYPDFWNGYFVRGVAYRRLGRAEEAQKDLLKVLELHADEPNTTMELALMKRDQYDFEAAANYAEKAITLAPRDPMFAVNGGLIMIEAGRCDRARELYNKAVRMVGPENAAILKDQLDVRCK
jgi:tetratricopeptide (TPR) repeat protein